jgi:tetratricopeptide (TPR) repeat protein
MLETTSATEIDRAVRATGQLPAIASCADPERLRERVPMPTEPGARAQAEALHTSLAATRALLKFGRYPAALEAARKVMASVGPATYAPYASQAHYVLGRALQALEKHDESIQELQLAQRSAEIGHDDELRADALDRLAEWAVDEATLDPRRVPEATELLAQLAALATRLDAPARLAAGLERESLLAENRGDQQEAIALSRRALALNERANDRDGIAMSASNVGMGLIGAGHYPEALPYLDRSTQLYRQLYGDDHPTAARMAAAYGAIYMNTSRGAEAVAAYRRAREIYRRAGLADTRDDFAARSNLAASLGALGRPDEAEAELVAVLKLVGDDPLGTGHILVNLGVNRAVAKQHDAAAAWLRKALAHTEPRLGANHPLTTTARAALAVELIELGKPREALPMLEASLPAQLKQSGQGSDDVAITQLALARAYLETGQARRAIALGDQALAFYATSTTAGDRGNARFVVARALVAAGADRARAIELATAARADFVEAKAPDLVAAVDRLLAQARR